VQARSILLIIAGGIAAYKALELIRLLTKRGLAVRAVLTASGAQFVTPMSIAALTGEKVYQELFSLTDETEMGHIELSRSAALVVVAPATADILAKMAQGLCDDLATALLLATDKPVLVAPAMNVRMWGHPATQDNVALLRRRGVTVLEPDEGPMACGEFGPGRLPEPPVIADAIALQLVQNRLPQDLVGKRALVTSGPTHEPIDPVRYIANRSSGKQGHAIAAALQARGATVTLVTGPVMLPDPAGVDTRPIVTAREMLAACQVVQAQGLDIAVCTAAVADWRVEGAGDHKLKKQHGGGPPTLCFTENPDILATLSAPGRTRPALVVGFAAETRDVVGYATAKRTRKGCDWIVANDVSGTTGTFGGGDNTVYLITADSAEAWPPMAKTAVAAQLVARIANQLSLTATKDPSS
jgi:phosphopantothenoylcysteine decarboxylase/phosphopantothenate--cysteine ligase